MKHVLRLVLALLVCADAATADLIGIYADREGTDCTLSDLLPLPANTLYIVHSLSPGALGGEFKVNDNSGLVLLTQAPTTGYLTIGSFYAGVRIAYGSCIAVSHVIGTLTYLWLNTPTTCESTLTVEPFPNEQTIIVYDCAQPQNRTAYGNILYVGPDADSCLPYGCFGHVNPTSETTWGAVKALYR